MFSESHFPPQRAFPKNNPPPAKRRGFFSFLNLYKKPVGCHGHLHYRTGNWGWERLSKFPKFAEVVKREPRLESLFVCLNVLCFSKTPASFIMISMNY